MTKAEVLAYRKLAWQLREQHHTTIFEGRLANTPEGNAAADAAVVQLARIDLLENHLNNVESAIFQREYLDTLPIPE